MAASWAPAYTNNPRPLFQFGHFMGLWVWENELRGRQSEQNRDVLSTHAQTDTHERPSYIQYVSDIVRRSHLWLTAGSGSASSFVLSAGALRGTMPTLTLINLAGPHDKLKH